VIEIFFAFFCIGYLLYQHQQFNEYYRLQLYNSNTDLIKRNEEKKLLVKEIHHRVKNNLQIVISLLRLQKSELQSTEAKKHFNDAINRIFVMALIHNKLYPLLETTNVNVHEFITDLGSKIIHISDLSDSVTLKVNSEIEKVGLKLINPLSLLVNELISNSTKHAFKNGKGTITIDIFRVQNNENIIFIYSDDGIWTEKKENHSNLGMGLIDTLTEQLEGEFSRENSKYTFKFKDFDSLNLNK
jgi:two-component sensor histidine kinase